MPVGTRLLVSVPIHTSTRRVVVVCQIIFTFGSVASSSFSACVLLRILLCAVPSSLPVYNTACALFVRVCVCACFLAFLFRTFGSVEFRVVLTHTTLPAQTTSSRHRETIFVSPCPPELVLLWSARALQQYSWNSFRAVAHFETLVAPKQSNPGQAGFGRR